MIKINIFLKLLQYLDPDFHQYSDLNDFNQLDMFDGDDIDLREPKANFSSSKRQFQCIAFTSQPPIKNTMSVQHGRKRNKSFADFVQEKPVLKL